MSESEATKVKRLILSHVTEGKPPAAVVLPRDRWLALRHELMPSLIDVGVIVLPSMQSAEESREHFLFNGIPIVSGDSEHVEMSARNVIFQYGTAHVERCGNKVKALVEAATEAMKKHGYALISADHGINRDVTALRFAVAGDDVLAERLKPIVLEFTGLEILTTTDTKKIAAAKVRDAMTVRAMTASYQSIGDRKP